MTDLQTAAQQAIGLICSARLCEVNSMSSRQEMLRLLIEATDILRAALAQQTEPVAWVDALKDAFFEGFTSVATYNDTLLNSPEEAWANYKLPHIALAQQAEPVEPVACANMEPSSAQLKSILDGLARCHVEQSASEFLRAWIRDWTAHKVYAPPQHPDTDCHTQGICQRSGYGIGKQAEPVALKHRHEWFRTGGMEPGQFRCIHCGVWGQEQSDPQIEDRLARHGIPKP